MPPTELTELQNDIDLLKDNDATDQGTETSNETGNTTGISESDQGTETNSTTEEDKTDETREADKTSLIKDRPSIKDITSKYPNVFKEFPELREAYFRDSQFAKIFPSIEDAQEASEEISALNVLRESTLSGDMTKLFDAVTEVDKLGAKRLAANFLPQLYKKDQELYSIATVPIFEALCRGFFTSSQDGNVQNAARLLSRFLFESDKVAEGKETRVKDFTKPSEVDQERQAYNAERFRNATTDVQEQISSKLGKLISDGLDPDNNMSGFVKKSIIQEVRQELERVLSKDENHLTAMRSFWARAQRDGYSTDAKGKLINAYLARARRVIPNLRDKIKREAIGESSKAAQNKEKQIHQVTSREKELPNGRVGDQKNGSTKFDPSKVKMIDWSKTSDSDILNDNVKYKG